MDAVGEKKGATAASDSEAEKEKMMAEQFEKAVVVSEAETGKMVGEGEKAVAPSEAENEKMVEVQQGDKAVAPLDAGNVKMVEGQQGGKGKAVAPSDSEQGDKAAAASDAENVQPQEENAVAASEAEIGAAEANDVTGGRLITLRSSDGEVHRVSEAAARLSGLLRGIIETNVTVTKGVILPTVDGATLVTVLQYCNKHAEAEAAAGVTTSAVDRAAASEALEAWDRDLLDRLSVRALSNLFNASSFLKIYRLAGAIALKVAADLARAIPPAESRPRSPPSPTSETPSTSTPSTSTPSPRRNRSRRPQR